LTKPNNHPTKLTITNQLTHQPITTAKKDLSKSNKNAQLQSALGPVLALDDNLATSPNYSAGELVVGRRREWE